MQIIAVHHAFDGGDFTAFTLCGQFQTTEYRLTVDEDRAGSALPQFAAMLGSGEVQLFTQHFQQGVMDRESCLVRFAIDVEKTEHLLVLTRLLVL